MVHREETRHDFAFIAGVIVGAVSGALVTLALTPMSGAQTREKVRERVGNLEPVKERASGLASSAQHLASASREKASGLVAKSPLPFGEATDGEDRLASEAAAVRPASSSTVAGQAESAAATVQGRIEHTQDPAEGARDAVDGNGLDEPQPTDTTARQP